MANTEYNEGDIDAAVVHARAIANYCLGKNKMDHYENYTRFADVIEQVRRERDEARAQIPCIPCEVG